MISLPAWLTGKAGGTGGDPAAVQAWQALPEPDLQRSAAELRWVVVDVETTGLNMMTDHLLAIGAVALRGGALDLEDSFEVVLHQDHVSTDDNILVHGIAGGEQCAGVAAHVALADFLRYVGKDPLVAFHAFFDEGMLARAMRQHLALTLRRPWLDLADLAPACVRPLPAGSHSLDDWLQHFGITVTRRHHAVADAVATAQLMQSLDGHARRAGAGSGADLLKLARDQRWLTRHQG